ncbi:MAG: hypothetical protein E6Q95_01675 [Chitinophagaceae bacterium]|nr:MAG: hypothetical protein E6Q95_01675 [Chitinophagaceae bacterium]
MMEQILQLVQQFGQQSVVNNAEVPNDKNNAVLAEAANTVTGGLQNILSGGGVQSLLSMFSGNASQNGIATNPVVGMMIGHLSKNLVGKLGLNPAIANTISNNIIPGVVSSLISKTQSSNSQDAGFNLNDLVSSLMGGGQPAQNATGGVDLQGLLTSVLGGGSQPAASQQVQGGGLQDIFNVITQGTQQNQQQGGLKDLVQSFFK